MPIPLETYSTCHFPEGGGGGGGRLTTKEAVSLNENRPNNSLTFLSHFWDTCIIMHRSLKFHRLFIYR